MFLHRNDSDLLSSLYLSLSTDLPRKDDPNNSPTACLLLLPPLAGGVVSPIAVVARAGSIEDAPSDEVAVSTNWRGAMMDGED